MHINTDVTRKEVSVKGEDELDEERWLGFFLTDDGIDVDNQLWTGDRGGGRVEGVECWGGCGHAEGVWGGSVNLKAKKIKCHGFQVESLVHFEECFR